MNYGSRNSVLIIGNGEAPAASLLRELINMSDCIIAADGGIDICREHGIYPHFIVGDFDSADPETIAAFPDAEIILMPDQNRHDLDKALEFARTMRPREIRVTAAFGRRVDHTIANLQLLRPDKTEKILEFHDTYGRLAVISSRRKMTLPVGTTISLFSFLPVTGVTLSGFEFPLDNRDYPDGFSGLSNKTIMEEVLITIKSGYLLVYIVNGPDSY